MGDAEAGSLASLSPAGRLEAATLAERSPLADKRVGERPVLTVHSIEVGSPVSSDPSTVSAKQKISNTGAGAAKRSGVGEATMPQLVAGPGKVIEKILIDLSLGIRRYNGP